MASPLIYLVGRDLRSQRKNAVLARWLARAGFCSSTGLPASVNFGTISAGEPAIDLVAGLSAALHMTDEHLLLCSVVRLLLGTLVVLFSGAYMAGEDRRRKILRPAARHDRLDHRAGLRQRSVQPVGLVRGDGSHVLSAGGFLPANNRALEAGVKYLVQSAAGSVLVLFGSRWCS